MKKAIIGSGAFARELRTYMGYDVPMFVDDEYFSDNNDNIHRLSEFDPLKYEVVIAIADPAVRERIVKNLPENTQYFTYIHPSAMIFDDSHIGVGCIICPNVIVSINTHLGNHTQLNMLTTIGHDSFIGNYFTSAPGAKVSGNCTIGDRVYLGTNGAIKEKITITSDVTIGLLGGVVKDITEKGTYVGVPTKKIK